MSRPVGGGSAAATRRALSLAALCALSAQPAGAALPQSQGRVLDAGPGQAYPSPAAALSAARPYDTIIVHGGEYSERLVIRVPVVLIGEGWPTLDGGGRGHVVEALAPVEIRGFVIRGSGARVDTEDAGIMVRDATARVIGNRFEDVFFGVYLKNARGSLVQGNRIRGKPFSPTRRGDGIRLWYSSGTILQGNDVAWTRDVVVYFSDSLVIAGNRVAEGRFGLHWMYSDHNRVERNRLTRNHVGAFIMYSADIVLRDNVFGGTAPFAGFGLGLKDSDAVRATGNLFVRNGAGLYLDNSPRDQSVANRFERNLLFGNAVGVKLLPAVRGNVFTGNELLENLEPVEIAGGGGGSFQNEWSGNSWSDFAGFDEDGDGIGDTPFVHARLADQILSRRPALRLFLLSPAVEALEILSRFFPLLRPQPVAVDSSPRLATPELTRWRTDPPVELPGAAVGRAAGAVAAAAWAGLGALALGIVGGLARRRRPGRRPAGSEAASRHAAGRSSP